MIRSGERPLNALAWIALAWISIGCMGCQFAPKKMPSVWPWDKEETKELPDRILAVWSDTVLHQKGLPGVRGFGGRIYFYKKDNTDPIEVDGGLAVYVFDADDLSPASQQPLRKFVFTPDQFVSHMSKTSIGPSYSVWLPWSEVGGPQMRLSLIARFEGRDGGSTISDPTIKLLPGIPKQESLAKSKTKTKGNDSDSPVQQASYAEPKSNEKEMIPESIKKPTGANREVKTIDLPPSFQRHIQPAGSIGQEVSAVKNPVSMESAVTTEVIDLRTRSTQPGQTKLGQRPGTFGRDIHEGRSMQPITRGSDWRTRRPAPGVKQDLATNPSETAKGSP
jgi:hypothetical protein